MECSSPLFITKNLDRHRFPFGLLVPCGKCALCLRARAREWALRILHELDYWPLSSFVTLTYAPESVPDNYSLRKKDLQNFWKLLRKRIAPRQIKYFACGEYGSQFSRPHYHAIILGLDYTETEILSQVWSRGLVDARPVLRERVSYTTGYMQKSFFTFPGSDREQPFRLVSNGIGKNFCDDNAERLREDLHVRVNGVRVGLPRYYKKRLEIDSKKLMLLSDDAKLKKLQRYINADRRWRTAYEKISPVKKLHMFDSFYRIEFADSIQRELDLKARLRVYNQLKENGL